MITAARSERAVLFTAVESCRLRKLVGTVVPGGETITDGNLRVSNMEPKFAGRPVVVDGGYSANEAVIMPRITLPSKICRCGGKSLTANLRWILVHIEHDPESMKTRKILRNYRRATATLASPRPESPTSATSPSADINPRNTPTTRSVTRHHQGDVYMKDNETLINRVKQPEGVPARLAAQIGFIVEVDQLKTVLRQSPLVAERRRENDAEHSWHLALMVPLLAEYADEPIDVGRTVELVLLHDLVEIYAGDTFLYDAAGQQDQQAREQTAADRLFALLPEDQCRRFRELWDEFEARQTAEARFAKAMDRLQPLLLNFNNCGGTWKTPGVTDADVRRRKSVIADASTELWDYARTLIELGAQRGWVPKEES